MKIFIINSEYPPVGGGSANTTINNARELVDLGHEVIVLTCSFKGLPRERIEDGVRVLRIASRRDHKDKSNAWEQLKFIFTGSLKAIKIVKEFRPDIQLPFFGAPSGFVSYFIWLFFRIPYIVTLQGGDVPGFRPYTFSTYHKIISPFLKVVWKKAAAVVANSDGLRELGYTWWRGVELGMIPNGTNIFTEEAPEHDWKEPRIIFVGRLVHQKGVDLLLPVLAQIEDKSWKLSLIGDGPKREEYELLSKELGLEDQVTFEGWKEKDEVHDLLLGANIFTCPSRHEGMPNVVLEAMAAGLPVVASEIAGSEDLVIHEKTGYLFPYESVADLKTALEKLIIDEKLRKKMGNASFQFAKDEFQWPDVVKRMDDLINKVLD